MFCPDCGAKALDGAEFCQKCGARLIKDASAQPAASDSAASIQQPGKAPTAVPKKKKSKKLFIILAVVFAFIVILIAANAGDIEKRGEQAERDEEYIRSQQQDSTGVKLSETYTNEEDGISFKYPSAWVPVSEDEFTSRFGKVEDAEYPIVLLANEIEDLPEENTYIMVSKFDATQDMIDHLYIDDEQFASTFDDDVTIENTSITEIDGVTARKITYLQKDGIGYQSYFYAAGAVLYRIDFSYKESLGNNQRFFDAIIDSYQITAVETASAEDFLFPLAVSSDAEKVFQEWESTHPLGEYYHLDLISDDEMDSEGNKVFLFTLETDGAGIFNMTIRKSDGYMEYIEKYGSMSMDEWYREWFGTSVNDSSGDTAPGYQEPIEYYYDLAGLYMGGTEKSTLSLSIYSSQEEGEATIGNAEINLDSGQFYSGLVIPIEGNGYKIETGTQEEVLLLDYTSDTTITLRLYIDGIFMEEYRMEQHYES